MIPQTKDEKKATEPAATPAPVQPRIAQFEPSPEQPEFADVATLGNWLRQGKTTPTRLAAHFFDRLDKHGGKFNAVVRVLRDRGMKEAQQAEAEMAAGTIRGPLHGIPYGIKDLFATTDSPTSWGAEPYRNQQFDFDATVVARLKAAGAVVVAKLAMVEIAGGMGYRQANASFTGPGKSPWNPSAWSGGSSSGPGAAVAAGLVPFAIGSETWGSIVTPAAFCGVTGLRPTYGRISRHGAMALSWTMDKLGPMTRTVDDAAFVLAALAGPDPEDPTTLPQPFVGIDPPTERRFRVGVFKDADRRMNKDAAANYKLSLELLAKFADFVEIKSPELPCETAASTIISAEMASAFADLIGSEKALKLTAPEDRLGGIGDRFILAKDYIAALRVRGKAIRAYADLLKDLDAVVTPTLGAGASPIDQPFSSFFGRYPVPNLGGPGNLIGLPCVCMPNGFADRGLPSSIQFVGKALGEGRILRIARELQSATDWHKKYPVI